MIFWVLDIDRLMAELSRTRKVFHSEADFQHALAWQIREHTPECEIRLEFNPAPEEVRKIYLDVWIPNESTAIELKYFTRHLDTTVRSERFVLRDQGAQDIRRYDFLRDIQRLEDEVSEGRARQGFAILLTNDPSYWQPPQRDETVDAAFRIHDGRNVNGELAWSPSASEGTTRGRTDSIRLKASYRMRYQDYSNLQGEKYGQFRYLNVSVP